MVVEKVNDIITDMDTYYNDSDLALILRNWELKELELMLEEWIETHGIMQNGTAARIVQVIKEFK